MPANVLISRDFENLYRFYEPFIIAHDFAYTFDLEIDTSRKKHGHKGSPAVGPEATLQVRWSSLWSKVMAWINVSTPRFGQISESSSLKRELVVVTAKLNTRAYAFASDVVDALEDALFVAAPLHFKLGSAVSANELLGTLSIRSERSPFRLLMVDGPTCNTSLHRHLGFGNTLSKAHSYSVDSKARSLLSLRLGFQGSDQVRTFTSELLQEFDGNDNAWIEFDEFRRLFVTHLGDENALNKLRDRIKIRFRSEAEVRALVEERAVLQRRANLKLELEARREINHIIRRCQRKRMKACCYRDCDGNLRQVRYTPSLAPQAKSNRCAGSKANSRRIHRRVSRTRYIKEMTVECGAKYSPTLLQGISPESPPVGKCSESSPFAFLERQSLPHPSFLGRSFVRESLQHPDMRHNARHPVFCDLIWVPICTQSPLSATELHSVMVSLKLRSQVHHQKAWRVFHSPPLYQGRARQCYPIFTHKYDRSEIVHPAIWGSLVAKQSIFNDSMMTSPACTGYVLRRKSSDSQEHLQIFFEHDGVHTVESPCQICLSGQHGCPSCFKLPEGLELNDYSYMSGDATHKRAESTLRMMHTDLTTRAALDHDRRTRHDCAEVLIKSIPCGAIIKFAILCDYTVAHLHHLFRSASVHGMDKLTFFYIPTENGLIEMDIKGSTSVDQRFNIPDHGAISVFRYGLNKAGARTIIFHGCRVSTSAAIGVFVRTNMLLTNFPSASIFLPHLDAITASLCSDSVQIGLQKTFLKV